MTTRHWLFIFRTLGGLAAGLGGLDAASAASCPFVGGPQFGGIEPPLAIDADCTDPDYNDRTLVIDSTEQKVLKITQDKSIAYTEVRAHFPATRRADELPAGITESPTTVRHQVIWRFPEKAYFRNRLVQQTYPLDFDMLNTVDERFAFETFGAFTVGVKPGSPITGYRVAAAAAKLAKAHAAKLYGSTARVHGYLYGQSGGSVQTLGAAEMTTGVWDGTVPVVIATDGLNIHSFMWAAHYALAVPEAKRRAIAGAAAPGAAVAIEAGLTADERAALDELLNAGFPRNVLETMEFDFASVLLGAGSIETLDPAYEHDFWSRPGYEGADPPAYLKAALVDGEATIASVTRNAQGTPVALAFDPQTVPPAGSVGMAATRYALLGAEGGKPSGEGAAALLSGKLDGAVLKLAEGKNPPALLAALAAGQKVRIDNRLALALAFYPRHAIPANGNPAYDQYRRSDGSPRFAQRPATPVPIAFLNNIRAAGGVRQTGRLKVKTIVFENLSDGNSYPYVAGFYEALVRQAMGAAAAARMFRISYQENGIHGAFLSPLPGKAGTMTVPTGGILHQVLLDLAAWAEEGTAPRPSTRYAIDARNQVSLAPSAKARGGNQPVVRLSANRASRVEVGVGQPVVLVGRIEVPPGAGGIVAHDWYLGGADPVFEPATRLARPRKRLTVVRSVRFPRPGEYMITFRGMAQRHGESDTTTPLYNMDRVRVVVR